jgi:AcrR family transcriptional regulator
MPRAPKAKASDAAHFADAIVDTALDLAEAQGWHDLRLYQVAERQGVGLERISAHFRDLDAVANAWFARARDAMLGVREPDLARLPPPERLHRVMMRWFDALAPHREVSGEIIREKLWPAHPHHWAPAIFDLSRLMHWFLDAARIASTGRQRALAEIGLTLIFIRALRIWLRDDTPGQLRTRAHLMRDLERADRRLGGRIARKVIR